MSEAAALVRKVLHLPKNVKVKFDKQCPRDTVYFVNEKYLKPTT